MGRESGASVLTWVLAGLAVAMVGGCVLVGVLFYGAARLVETSSSSIEGATSAPEYELGEEMRFGDLGVRVHKARNRRYTATSAIKEEMQAGPSFVVEIEFRNHNPNRVAQAGSQADVCVLEDDVGNTYKRVRYVEGDFGTRGAIDGQVPPGQSRPVRSDEPQRDVLVFERPVPGASKVVLTLDAGRYGGAGEVKVVIPRSAWEPKPAK